MQSGGGLPPFASYTPVMVNDAQAQYYTGGYDYTNRKSSKSSGEDDTKGEITNKDLLTMLKDIDGLPSDMKVLYSELSKFFQLQDLGINTASLSMQYLRAIEQIKLAKYNKEVFDDAYKIVESNGGLNEYAISESGKLIGINDKEELRQMTYQELQESKEFHPITNAELLQLRAESPDKAFQNTLSQIASNGIGIEKVSELIKNNLYKLGTNEESYEGFITGKDNQQGLQLLKSLMASDKVSAGTDLDGLYKAKVVTEEQLSKIKGVLDYAYTMLPKNAKTLLAIKNEGSIEKSYNLIYQMLVGTANTSSEISLDYIEDAYGNKPGEKQKNNSNSEKEIGAATQWMLGYGPKKNFVIQDGSSQGYSIQATQGSLLNGGKQLGVNVTLDEVSKSDYSGMMDWNNATMGGELINPSGMDKVIVQDGKIYMVELPYERDEFNNIKPDYDALHRKEIADKEIRRRGIDINNKQDIKNNVEIINSIYQQNNLPAKYDQSGNLLSNNYQAFAVMNAVSINNILENKGEDNKKLEEIDDDNVIDNITNTIRYKNNWDSSKNDNYNFFDKGWLGGLFGGDKYVRGTIFVPIDMNFWASQSGKDIKPTQALEIEALQQASDSLRTNAPTYINPNSIDRSKLLK